MENIKNIKFGTLLNNKIREKYGSQESFAKKLGVTQATISRYISGTSFPKIDKLNQISDFLGIDINTLISYQRGKEYTETKFSNDSSIALPFFYSEVSAGTGLSALGSDYDTIAFDKKWLHSEFLINDFEDIFCVRVSGDSMEPLIYEKDIIFAKKYNNNLLTSHSIYVVCYNDEYFIKKIQRKNNNIIKLISQNKDYDPIEINLDDEFKDFRLIAKIIGKINTKSFQFN